MADLEQVVAKLQRDVARLEKSRGATLRMGPVSRVEGVTPDGNDIEADAGIWQGLVWVTLDGKDVGPVAVMTPVIEWKRYTRVNIDIGGGKAFYEPLVSYPKVGDQMAVWWLGGDFYAGMGVTKIVRN